jgi:hypothetical protein
MNRDQRRALIKRWNLLHAARYEIDDVIERLIGTHIFEFASQDAAMKISITIGRDLVIKAQLLGWKFDELIAEAVRISAPGATNITVGGVAPPLAN